MKVAQGGGGLTAHEVVDARCNCGYIRAPAYPSADLRVGIEACGVPEVKR